MKKTFFILTFLVGKDKKICSYLKKVRIKNSQFNELAGSMKIECKLHNMNCCIYNKKLELCFYCDFINIVCMNLHKK